VGTRPEGSVVGELWGEGCRGRERGFNIDREEVIGQQFGGRVRRLDNKFT